MPSELPGDDYVDARRRQIGTAISSARRWANLTAEQVSDRSGVDSKTISRVENAVVEPRLGTLIRIAYGIGVPLSQFMGEPRPTADGDQGTAGT